MICNRAAECAEVSHPVFISHSIFRQLFSALTRRRENLNWIDFPHFSCTHGHVPHSLTTFSPLGNIKTNSGFFDSLSALTSATIYNNRKDSRKSCISSNFTIKSIPKISRHHTRKGENLFDFQKKPPRYHLLATWYFHSEVSHIIEFQISLRPTQCKQ